MILGFGSQEQEREKVEGEFVDAFVRDHKGDDGYITDRLVEELKFALNEHALEAQTLANQYKTGDHPPRYSTFWFSILHDASNVVVIFRFMHINRQHAMSPDGWAALSNTCLHHAEL